MSDAAHNAVFLSYAREDAEVARRIAEALVPDAETRARAGDVRAVVPAAALARVDAEPDRRPGERAAEALWARR